jgi:3'-phosphoadenosine 5'-phosphosulfate sulfotransferase (PAPS reductase)/FAD synthetase
MESFDPQASRIARNAAAQFPAHVLAFSGGTDSAILLDFLVRYCDLRPPLLWVDPGFELPGTEHHIRAVATRYHLSLHIAAPTAPAPEHWARSGYPLLGKESGAKWNASHPGFGFKASPSDCCRRRKLQPGRALSRAIGAELQFVATRGEADSNTRGFRAKTDGTLYEQDGLWICTPLSGWTDLRIRTYLSRHDVPILPARKDGRVTNTGCNTVCGGGSQFSGSNFREMRKAFPAEWARTIRDRGFGRLILAIKYDAPLSAIDRALEAAGGIQRLMDSRPWVFDFTRETPIQGYRR